MPRRRCPPAARRGTRDYAALAGLAGHGARRLRTTRPPTPARGAAEDRPRAGHAQGAGQCDRETRRRRHAVLARRANASRQELAHKVDDGCAPKAIRSRAPSGESPVRCLERRAPRLHMEGDARGSTVSTTRARSRRDANASWAGIGRELLLEGGAAVGQTAVSRARRLRPAGDQLVGAGSRWSRSWGRLFVLDGIARSRASSGGAGRARRRHLGMGDGASALALREIPPVTCALYQQAARRYGLDWAILAGIGKVECDHGRDPDPSCTSEGAVNSAGAGGPMQFIASTWAAYGVSGEGDGRPDRWNPADAIYCGRQLPARLGRAGGLPSRHLRLQPRELVRRRGRKLGREVPRPSLAATTAAGVNRPKAAGGGGRIQRRKAPRRCGSSRANARCSIPRTAISR